MADNKLIGQNYTTPDLVAKVTGKAKYAEDYRVEGMLFAKLLVSPMPHARVKRLDTSAALAMPGVKAILTADDMPGAAAGATLGEGVQATAQAERGLTNEPLYQGEPILAVAAVDEATAAEAIEAIEIEFEPLPFVVDPIESLRPGGPNARAQGNVWMRPPRRRPRRARAARRTRRAAPTPAAPRDADTGRPLPASSAGAAPGAARPGSRPGRAGAAAPAADAAAPDAVDAAQPRDRRRRRSPCGSGPTRISPTPATARCRLGKATDEWIVRQRRGRVQESRPRPRRNVHDAVDRPSAARNAHGDGLLAERQAATCTARRRAPCRRSPRSRAGPASRRTRS